MENEEYKTLSWMKHLGDEFEYIGKSPLQAKFKIMLLMVYIDIFSQIWGLFIEYGLSTKIQKERFSRWSDKFIFSETNDYYASRQDEFHLLNGELLYKIRNSILHFGGLPNELLSNLVYGRPESSGFPAHLSLVNPIDELHVGDHVGQMTEAA